MDLEKKRARQRAWYRRNRQRHAEWMRRWRAKNLEHAKARVRKYNRENPQVVAAAVERYRAKNPNLRREIEARRRLRKKGTEVGPIDSDRILRESGGICGICRQPLDNSGHDFDHIVPLAASGTHTEDNIQVAHARCNRSKGAKVAA